LSIRIYYDNVKFRLRESERIKYFLDKVIRNGNKETGDLVFVFTNEEEMLKINREFLEHDYYTDVISFGYGTGKEISGEIYLGIETIRNNSVLFNVSLKEEVMRIMIHGTLHLMGYMDNENEERNKMITFQEKLVNEFMNKD
jgi:rRNA maturation RNase YbeY